MIRTLLAALLLVGSSVACAAAPEPYETRAEHDPDGIGKFYLGREIAHVMGPGGVPWLERQQRESEERPQLTIAALEIKPGQTIADLGAGSGYYSFRIAPLVGERGSVLAIDVEPRMLRIISERAQRDGIKNITTVLSTPSDPNLEPNSIDLLFMVDVYHELEYPFEVMTKVREALKPGGRVALIEYRAEDPAVMIKPVHKMTERQIVKELTAAGFKHQKTIRTLPLQHLVLFQK
ncbi:class I SAM-dependent methyltransferase [Steroidobacter agaridevorans]|uniref:class I SAM-dependent methyltransferase n=1 Tax=Steroidobacter agaridevorans TaxID=2695856 RepID=UPI001323A9F9|nr:methyltransferase domain-containing protein [Steroidobacter agaridevorans]GFE86162.1 methyltransferase type 11 [Steroidobacter agaridevorans]